jgi:hypothetical protein
LKIYTRGLVITKLTFGLITLLIFVGCGQEKARLVENSGTVAYVDSTMEYPHLKYADGQVSLNDKCMIRLNKLSPKMPPIYVNGRPVGFC